MKADQQTRLAVLAEIGKRCRAAGINYYRIEIALDDAIGWRAQFDIASPKTPDLEAEFERIVAEVRHGFRPL